MHIFSSFIDHPFLFTRSARLSYAYLWHISISLAARVSPVRDDGEFTNDEKGLLDREDGWPNLFVVLWNGPATQLNFLIFLIEPFSGVPIDGNSDSLLFENEIVGVAALGNADRYNL